MFLGEELSPEKTTYIERMLQAGFQGVFTSMHIPEDDASLYMQRIKDLGALTSQYKQKLMVDISEDGLAMLGVSLSDGVDQLLDLGITGIRMDYGIPMEQIAFVSNKMTIGLNASTLTQSDIDELKSHQANFSNMEFWHNYYPRVETGLDENLFHKKNEWLKQLGGKVIAFVPGDEQLRGPLYNHLPTLEKHRYIHPLAGAIDLLTNYFVDEVYIGDEKISQRVINQFNTFTTQQIIEMDVVMLDNSYNQLILCNHKSRLDPARDVVRCGLSRFKELPEIKSVNTINRSKGSLTLDNKLYERYMGEFQISKLDLPADPRVSVMGKVLDYDLDLIDIITPGQIYRFNNK